MTRAEKKAIQTRIAVGVWAMQAAKRAIKEPTSRPRSEGARCYGRRRSRYAPRGCSQHPKMFVEAREKAAALGYTIPTI